MGSGKMTETLQLRGALRGHNGWVTQITTNPKYPDMILSSSRDKSLIVWKLTRDDVGNYGIPQKRLHGHGHFISDVVLSLDGHFALSGSWDKTLRLWDLAAGQTTILLLCQVDGIKLSRCGASLTASLKLTTLVI